MCNPLAPSISRLPHRGLSWASHSQEWDALRRLCRCWTGMWLPTDYQRPASVRMFEGSVPSARAILKRFKNVTLRSPRSILPMWARSIPTSSANASCERLSDLRFFRITSPTRKSTPSPSVCPEIRCIQHCSSSAALNSTAFTTQNNSLSNEAHGWW